jgi:hypothetical protein
MQVGLDDIIHLVPVGCESCGGTQLTALGDGKYSCKYCDAVILRDPPPPIPKVLQQRGGEIPPASQRSTLDAAERLRDIHLSSGAAAVDPRVVLAAVDAEGPGGPFTRKPLSAGITLGKAGRYAPVRVMYTCFCERRTIEQTSVAYTGQVPSQDPIPQPWTNPPRELTEPNEEQVPLRVKEVVADCEACRGKGSSQCSMCQGNGRSDCMSCDNGKQGDGQTCSSCSGKGHTDCMSCNGNGRTACAPCNGKGQVLKGHELKVVHAGRSASDAMSSDRDWGDFPWLEEAEGELLFDTVSAGMTELAPAEGPIYDMVREVVNNQNEALDRTDFVFWSRLTLTRIPVIEAQYGVGSSDSGDTLHVFGRQKQVAMPGATPWGCGCLTMGTPVVLLALMTSLWIL